MKQPIAFDRLPCVNVSLSGNQRVTCREHFDEILHLNPQALSCYISHKALFIAVAKDNI
jgi:hypothetical protein